MDLSVEWGSGHQVRWQLEPPRWVSATSGRARWSTECTKIGGSKICCMFPSHACFIHESCHTAISNVSVNKNLAQSLQFLSEWGPTTITSDSINLARASCQLKVEGAIILARAKVASHWPSVCYCSRIQGATWRYAIHSRWQISIYGQAMHIGMHRTLSQRRGQISQRAQQQPRHLN